MTNEEAKLVLDNARPQTKEIDRQFYDDEDLNNALDMAIKALEQQPSEDCLEVGDCVSRKAVFEAIDDCNSDGLKGIFCSYADGERFKEYIKKLSPVTPTQCIATVQFNKEELREICNERIEIECTHGTCKDCSHRDPEDKKCDCGHTIQWQLPRPDNWYCADFEKRGNENDV